MLDPDQLRSFIAIVEVGSFTRAAERVNKTQSAVSMHIRRLERQLGTPLFHRSQGAVHLSPTGLRLVDHARRILQAEAAALAELQTTGLTGRLVFGIPDDYATAYLSGILEQFTDTHPGVAIVVHCEDSRNLVNGIRDGRIDLALVTEGPGIAKMDVLRDEPLLWVTGLHARTVELERPLPVALPPVELPGHAQAMAALAQAGVAARLLLTSKSYAAIAPVLQSGQAVTVLPEGLIDRSMLRICPQAAGLPALPRVRYGIVSCDEVSRNSAAMREVLEGRLSTMR